MKFKFYREKDGTLHAAKHFVTTAMIKEAFLSHSEEGSAESGALYRIGTTQFGEKLKIIFTWNIQDAEVFIITAYEIP